MNGDRNRTVELYYEDAYQTKFTAQVISCERNPKGKGFLAVLDRTAFFPEQGGQKADRGTLGGKNVLDVHKKNGVITHLLDGEILSGARVEGCIDWERRFDFMQQHTGEHMCSGIVHSLFGYDNVGFHLSEQETRLDFNGKMTEEELLKVEEKVNRAIWNNLPVRVTYPDANTLKILSYRSKLELTEAVRIVEIPEIDRCACCAPHVKRTGEIGVVKILSAIHYKGGMRITIACGMRALNDYRKIREAGGHISVLLSAKQEEIFDAVKALKEKLRESELKNFAMGHALLQERAKTLPAPNLSKHAILFVDDATADDMRELVNAWSETYAGISAVFCGSEEEGWRFVLKSGEGDCAHIAEELKKQGFRFGGGMGYLQGMARKTKEEISHILTVL